MSKKRSNAAQAAVGHGSKSIGETFYKEKGTCTEPLQRLLCDGCWQRLGNGDRLLMKEYARSIDYINYCHSVLNNLAKNEQKHLKVGMPELPNFLAIHAAIYGTAESKRKLKYELDNIEGLDELYATLDLDEIASTLERNQASPYSSDDDGKRAKSNIPRLIRKNSPIPSDDSRSYAKVSAPPAKSKPSLQGSKDTKGNVLRNRSRTRSEESCSSEELLQKKRAKNQPSSGQSTPMSLSPLPSVVGTPDISPKSSPRSIISNSSKCEKRRTRITYKTRSDASINLPKGKPKQAPKTTKKRSVTIVEGKKPHTKKKPELKKGRESDSKDDNSDIEPDDSRQLSTLLAKKKSSSTRTPSPRNVYIESDIQQIITINNSQRDVYATEETPPKIINTYNQLKAMVNKQAAPKNSLFGAQNGKLKNTNFRSRQYEDYDDEIIVRNSSSDIKTDDECEIRNHRIDSTHHPYKCQ